MTTTSTLATRLAEVRARIAQSCERAGRDPATVTRWLHAELGVTAL